MPHWFDGFVKRAARGGISRREILAGGVVSGLSIAVRGIPGAAVFAGDAAAQPAPGDGRNPQVTPSAVTTFEPVVVSRNGLTVRQQMSFDRASLTAGLDLTISRGRTLIVKVSASVQNGSQTVVMNYGPEVNGLQNATMSSRDGRAFSGRINGREFTTNGPIGSLDEVEFADQKPPPQVSIVQTLPLSITAVWQEARTAIKSMRAVPVLEPALQIPIVAPLPPPGLNARIARPAGNWTTPRSRNIPACDHCYDDCNASYADCVGDFDDIANILCPPCWGARVAACSLKWGANMGLCNVPGGGCCPVPCGSITDNCCGPDTVCMQPKQRTCCPTDRALCGGFCCEKGTMTCAPDGFCGCPGDQTACGDFCCQAGEICSDGQCFSPSECSDGTCCHAPSHICNGVCCPPFNGCCSGVCCSNAGACIDGQCCPTANRCGTACCANGEACLDPAASVCGAPTTCTPVSKMVFTRTGVQTIQVPRFPCRTLTADRRFVTVCCEGGLDCCLGACCGTGRICCQPVGGSVGCNLPSVCGPH